MEGLTMWRPMPDPLNIWKSLLEDCVLSTPAAQPGSQVILTDASEAWFVSCIRIRLLFPQDRDLVLFMAKVIATQPI